jgi:hypothetical protein
MTKPHARVELDQPGLDRGSPGLSRDPEPLGCPPHQHRLTRRIRRRDQQQHSGLVRQGREPPPEALLDPPRERHRVRECEPARQLRGRQPARQLQQRQRVTARLGDDLVADPRVQRPWERRVEQRSRVALAQALDHELGQSRYGVARRARGKHQADRFRLQPTRDEREGLRRGAIEPLLVIHDANQRLLLGHVREQAQNRQADEKAIRRRPGTDAERRPHRGALRTGETLEAIQHRRQQLMQPGERQLHLRLDTSGTEHT